ncbi:MAG TPA: DUF58 domain-containing protein [Streptosporangiaceae bacterium]
MTAGEPLPVRVSWRLSRHGRRLITLALAGLLLAVVTRRPEFAGVAAPAVLLLAGWRRDRPQAIGLRVALSSASITEGEQASVIAEATGLAGHAGRLRLQPADFVTPAWPSVAGTVTADGTARYRLPFRAERWGRRPVGTAELILTDRLHLAEGRARAWIPQLACYPAPATLDRPVVLSALPSRLGEHPARAAGEGIEFAGVRAFVPGDRQRRVNWPATTRRGSLQLNTFSAERAQNVVLIVDASTDVGEPGASSLDLAVRAAAGIARCYLTARDRIGLVIYGGHPAWVSPATGRRQFHRMADLTLASPAAHGRAGALTRLPRAALPAGALVLVLSPLLQPALIEALRDLRERGCTMLIIDVLNTGPQRDAGGRRPLLLRGPGSRAAVVSPLAQRVWTMEQQAIRFSLRELGIPVVHWDGQQALDQPLAPYARRVMVVRR